MSKYFNFNMFSEFFTFGILNEPTLVLVFRVLEFDFIFYVNLVLLVYYIGVIVLLSVVEFYLKFEILELMGIENSYAVSKGSTRVELLKIQIKLLIV